MSKNKPQREVKKPKKSAKKESLSSIITSSPEPEVVKKVRKNKEEVSP